ncbi:MAG: type II toxin-antitoxin system Phd/YefM family antitoxin [Anaerolineaceae bacterium]|nr:type II toxin-antitoxin system Phd/YefM family antitoxin [Anaerolineaceae bacterium]
MVKRVSASEAKNRFGAIVDWAVQSQQEVIVESYGEPKVVILSYEAYTEIEQLREAARRQEALARLRQLRDEVRARNQDLTPEEAQALSDRFSREAATEMVQEGKIAFQEE